MTFKSLMDFSWGSSGVYVGRLRSLPFPLEELLGVNSEVELTGRGLNEAGESKESYESKPCSLPFPLIELLCMNSGVESYGTELDGL